jgi:hypothetical protein
MKTAVQVVAMMVLAAWLDRLAWSRRFQADLKARPWYYDGLRQVHESLLAESQKNLSLLESQVARQQALTLRCAAAPR